MSIFWLLATSLAVLAQPNFAVFRDVAGIRAFQDLKEPGLWYLSPSPPRLAQDQDGSPAYALEAFAYYGRKATGDQGVFWQKVILTLGFERSWPQQARERLRQSLAQEYSRPIKFRTLPISQAKIQLIYAGETYTRTWSTRWRPEKIILPLEEHLGALLWEAARRGQVLLSLVVEETAQGVRLEKGVPKPASLTWPWTLPIKLDQKHYPEKFRLHDLGAKLERAYTRIDILCLDFVEGTLPGLYATLVEIGFPVKGRLLVKQVRFGENSPFHQQVVFPLAHETSRPYRFRVIRIFEDGRQETGPWRERRGERPLDVTLYRNIQTQEER